MNVSGARTETGSCPVHLGGGIRLSEYLRLAPLGRGGGTGVTGVAAGPGTGTGAGGGGPPDRERHTTQFWGSWAESKNEVTGLGTGTGAGAGQGNGREDNGANRLFELDGGAAGGAHLEPCLGVGSTGRGRGTGREQEAAGGAATGRT